MIEVMGVAMEQFELDEMIAQITQTWNDMEEWERECYDDFEDYEYITLHSYLYSDEE